MTTKTMHAVGFTQSLPIADEEALVDLTMPMPEVKGRDLLIEVKAVSVNPIDCKQRKVAATGAPLATAKILGWDVAGVVATVGDTVQEFAVGDEVYYAGSLIRDGANVQYHVVDERIVAPKPKTLSYAQAAALPLTTITAWESLFERLGYPEQGAHGTLLIINGAGGVGSIATQIATLAGLTVITTASRPATQNWCKKMGATHVISHKHALKEQLDALDIQEIDAALCCIAPDAYLQQMADILKPQGKICAIVDNEQPLDMKCLKPKSISFHFEFMFTKTMFNTPDVASQGNLLMQVADCVDAGYIQTTLNTTFAPINANNLKKAHAQLENGGTIGKIVVHN